MELNRRKTCKSGRLFLKAGIPSFVSHLLHVRLGMYYINHELVVWSKDAERVTKWHLEVTLFTYLKFLSHQVRLLNLYDLSLTYIWRHNESS